MSRLETYDSLPTFSYWSTLVGVEVKDIEFEDKTYILVVAGTFAGRRTAHRLRVYYSATKGPYVRLYGTRLYVRECIRYNSI